MSDKLSNDLRIAIRAKMAAKTLPTEIPKSVVAHFGKSLSCDACDLPIGADERECEVHFRGYGVLRLHQACLVIWQDEAGKGKSATICAKVAKGKLPLPSTPPKQVWAGKGTGRPCDCCDETITPTQIEYEIDIAGGRALFVHPHCLELWHQARLEQGEISGGSDVTWPGMRNIVIARELCISAREARSVAARVRERSRAVCAITAQLLASYFTVQK